MPRNRKPGEAARRPGSKQSAVRADERHADSYCQLDLVPAPIGVFMRRFRLVRLCGLAVLALALLVPALPAQAAVTKVGTYYAVKPARLLDTRTGLGAPAKQKLAPGKALTLKVAGRGGVPTGGVSAVVFNVTATNVTATTGYVSVYPAGTSRPATSSVNVAKGRTTANSATVKLGSAGSVTIYNSRAGSTEAGPGMVRSRVATPVNERLGVRAALATTACRISSRPLA